MLISGQITELTWPKCLKRLRLIKTAAKKHRLKNSHVEVTEIGPSNWIGSSWFREAKVLYKIKWTYEVR